MSGLLGPLHAAGAGGNQRLANCSTRSTPSSARRARPSWPSPSKTSSKSRSPTSWRRRRARRNAQGTSSLHAGSGPPPSRRAETFIALAQWHAAGKKRQMPGPQGRNPDRSFQRKRAKEVKGAK